MKNNPLVSISVPFFNDQKNLDQCILSILNQTFTNFELILIDDGSFDNSLEIANKYKKSDDRIRVFSDGKNLGLPKRLNQSIKLSKGLYYARMDADDIMFVNRIEEQLKFLNMNSSLKIIGSEAIAIDNLNNIIGLKSQGFSIRNLDRSFILNNGLFIHPSVFGFKSWFAENQYDENLFRCQDLDLWIRAFSPRDFGVIKRPLLFYREDLNQTQQKNNLANNYNLRILKKNLKYFKKIEIFKFFLNFIMKAIVYKLFKIFGGTNYLIKRRVIMLPLSSVNEFKNELKYSLNE